MNYTITDTPIRQNHVSPLLCSDLKYAGFKAPTEFFWKVYDHNVILGSFLFDTDDYYRNGNKRVDEVNLLREKLPAWTIKEIEMHLPAFTVSKNNGYYLSLTGIPVPEVLAIRLPDAFALMMLSCIRKSIVNINHLNTTR